MQTVTVTCDGYSYSGRYVDGDILTPLLLENNKTIWVHTLRVENPPERITGSIRRAMVDRVAAMQGGCLVTISAA